MNESEIFVTGPMGGLGFISEPEEVEIDFEKDDESDLFEDEEDEDEEEEESDLEGDD